MIQESESDSERDFAELERKLMLGRKRKVSCRNGWKLQSHVYGSTPTVTLTYLLLEQKSSLNFERSPSFVDPGTVIILLSCAESH